MTDIPGNSSTTVTVTVGSTTNGTLEINGDHDWFRIDLVAGQAITVSLNGVTLEDPYLYLRNSSGALLYENDDISSGINRNSELGFTANYTGTYYIDVGAWNDGYAGAYQVTVAAYTPPPVWTMDQIANQLTHGYWGGQDHHFNARPGGSITVNLSGLTPAGQTLARAALATWTDIIGINFPEVMTGGQITFDDNQEGAFADATWSNGITSSARVNVSTQWLTDYGTGLNTYSFQTYIHEVGHALGLGHAGDYNNTARYPYDSSFANDSWPVTIMSYFDQRENDYFAGQGFNHNYVVTPMMADIVAITNLYGVSTTTRTGDTSYGPGWNTSMGALTIFDSGGTDTFDASSLSGSHRIDLNPGTFSDVLGEVGNIGIALGVIIENARGGAGNDRITGNEANNLLEGGAGADTIGGNGGNDILTGGANADSLSGGAGADTFRDTAAGLNGDLINDFTAQDRIVISDANLSTFTFSISGANVLTYSGGSLTFGSLSSHNFVARAATGGGVELVLASSNTPPPSSNDAANDFNGDGRSDILWRNDNGTVTDWLATANGGFVDNAGAISRSVPVDWKVIGTGDFNGDGRDDILWRHTNGTLTDWLATANGGFVDNNVAFTRQIANDWKTVGTGDFNGDGRDDILWRNDNGMLTDWLGTANGGFADNASVIARQVTVDWKVIGTGDFNGDGRDDILWRNDNGTLTDWLGTADGGFADNASAFARFVSNDWEVIGTGDFNGDGRDDILWRNDNGTLTNWLATASGGFVDNNGAFTRSISNDWQVEGIGDYNGDGRDDVLWRNDNGTVTNWLGTANGAFADNATVISRAVSNDWQVQPDDYLLG